MHLPAAHRLSRAFVLVALWLALAATALAAVPGAPGTPAAVPVEGDDAAVVSFAAPAADGGSPITGYLVESSPAHGFDNDYGAPSLSHYFMNLVPGTTYTFTVRATNADGTGPASAPSAPITVPSIPRLSVADAGFAEGTGIAKVGELQATLTEPLARDLVVTVSMQSGEATANVDFKDASGLELTLPAGATSLAIPVKVYSDSSDEADERFTVSLHVPQGDDVRVLDGTAQVTILDDDTGHALQARPDYLLMSVDQPQVALNPVANDVYDEDDLYYGSLTLLGQPDEGVVVHYSGGNGYDPTDDTMTWYPPEEGFVGEATFDYELCDQDDRCTQATVRIVSVFYAGAYVDYTNVAHGGASTSTYGQTDVVGARFVTTAPVAPVATPLALGANLVPERIWDAPPSARFVLRTVPAPPGGQARHLGLYAEAVGAPGSGSHGTNVVHMYLGVDTDGDGKPSEDEVRCARTSSYSEPRCSLDVLQAAGTSVTYWTMLQNMLPEALGVWLHSYEVPEVPSDGTMSMSGPGIIGKGERFQMHHSYEFPGLQVGERRVAFVHVFDENGRYGPPSPFLVAPSSMWPTAYPLRPGRTQTIRLKPGQVYEGLFFDVPAGTSSMTVTTRSAGDLDLSVLRSTQEEHSYYSYVSMDMAWSALVSANPGGNEQVTRASPQTGRYFVRLSGSPTASVDVEVDVTLVGNAPVVRQGSYFNPGRPGSGLFLSPAGGDLAGLWYTYYDDMSPTWYYLQGAKPGPNGIWTSEVWRSAWDGDSNHLVDVGHAVIAPVGPDKFRISYVLDGKSGAQTYQALGRGCPSLGGAPVDISSQWFDPATAGTGYSVQTWSNYEFYAAFVYDRHGVPRFMSAETDGFKGATATLQLDQMRGECPTCANNTAYVPHSSRQPAGTFTREIAGGRLQRVSIDATYVPATLYPWEGGRWTGDDDVQLLGGAGTTQGCAP